MCGRRVGEFSFNLVYFKENKKNGVSKLYLSVRHGMKICWVAFSLKESTILC